MTSISLTSPSIELREEYMDFYRDWKDSGEEMVPWVIEKDPIEYEEMLDFLSKNEDKQFIPEGWVPSSTYWLVVDDRKVVGAVNIRHGLTEKLFNSGGHIGYGIRPSERKKGYATRLLALSLERSKEIGISNALVVCDDYNIASRKTILNNGGVQDSNFIEEDGNVINRFWIKLE
ncbi:GNAT family N-acetyltransferase [Paenibacillus crassostreae]|uniref:GCN5 family acetyltransferase n=1 Tax=Paenibacillus crassostreae TaxID=1763538 RepID=A0A167FDP9_9BACL|nr:GNAT family N-acetyltransferase [Paenibacillus crassostreae]AOZ90788.1 GNAT family N-acetyltransferase [Paenibacillus crassostreae]OAB76446.1 GCN5 family acetyltransferase [Paenibacillus crassostreae]